MPVLLWYGTPIPYSKTYDFIINLEEDMPTHSKITPSDEMPAVPEELRSDDNLARFLYKLTAADDAIAWNFLDGAGERAVRDRYLEAAGKVRQMFLPFQQATADGQVRKELRDKLAEHQGFVDDLRRALQLGSWGAGMTFKKQSKDLLLAIAMLKSARDRAVDVRVLTELWKGQAEQLRATSALMVAAMPEEARTLRGIAAGLEIAQSLTVEALDGTLVTEKTEED